MKRPVLLLITLVSMLCGGFAAAHTLGIDKAELVELGDGNYRLSSFVPPALANYISTPELPGHCTYTGSPRGERGIYEVRFLFSCDGPLSAEHEIRLPWNREGIMLTVQWKDQEPTTRFTKRTGAVITIDLTHYLAGSGSFLNAAKRYTLLGIEHILVGLDHLLFVAGLVLIVSGIWPLVKTITAFTLAHSLTLALATLGFFNLPPKPVEAAIALSIVFLAMEIIRGWQGRTSITHRKPWLVAFGFGLLHGLGFAGALSEIGLPPPEIPVALLFFNIGVEIGQLIFVFFILLNKAIFTRMGRAWPSWSRLVPVYMIGTIACYWLFERMGGILFS